MVCDRPAVSMIGLGSMGSALATAIASGGHGLTVWNRSAEKCLAAAERGASVADSVGSAVSRSDVIVVCVRGYDAAASLFQSPGVAPLLMGKTVIQLGNGVPTEVAEAAAWFADQGAPYLDGSIMTFPDAVGSAECQVLVSGDPAAFQRCASVFDAVGGDVRFLGSDATASAVINTSGLAFVYVAAHAFVSAAAMCDASGAPLDLLADVVGTFSGQMPAIFGEYVEMIAAGSYESSSLRLASGAENLQAIAEFGRASGVDIGLFESALETFQDATRAGLGVNLAAIFDILKQSPG